MSDIRIEIESIISSYNEIIMNISNKKNHQINAILWQIRADLEILVVELKFLLQKNYKIEKWQSKFHKELKGTKLKEKAKTSLEKNNKNAKEIIALFSTNPEECYKYLWKLKEVIASVLDAFPSEKYIWRNGELKKDSDEVFEI